MSAASPAPGPRRALLAGSTGLVGHELLARLKVAPQYNVTHLLLRRPMPIGAKSEQTVDHVIDFAALPQLPAIDDVYIALGTTIKVAGSQQAFRRVDYDAVVNTARAARHSGARRLAVVSAYGSSPSSTLFYSRVKGEMEEAVCTLGYEIVVIAQPSFLVGLRSPLGQPERPGERWALRLMRPLDKMIPRNMGPIDASQVAQALINGVCTLGPGVHRLRGEEMRR